MGFAFAPNARFVKHQRKAAISCFCRYDWSIVSKVAQEHPLDLVVGGSMGAEYVDMFSCLVLRNMKNILIKILVLLGDMDLIR